MISLLLIPKIFTLFLIMFAGTLAVKAGLLKVEDSKPLSSLMLFLISPCTILSAFQIEYTEQAKSGLLLSFLAAFIVFGLYLLVARILRKLFHLNCLEECSLIFSNAGNIIIPLVSAIFGKEYVIYCCGYISVNTIFLWSYGKALLDREGGASLKKAFLNINIVSIAIGLVLFLTRTPLPEVVSSAVDSVGGMIGPFAMIIVGILIADMNFRQFFSYRRLPFILFSRLIAFPLLAVALLKYSPLSQMVENGEQLLFITLFGAAAPCAANLPMMAKMYKEDSCYASVLNIGSTLLFIISLPLMAALYQL